jgi:hypothetical protein
MNEAVVFSLVIRAALAVAVLAYLRLAFIEYRTYRDARGLRGFVGAVTMTFGVVALSGSSNALREAWPDMETPLRVITATGVFGFMAGIVFSGYAAWRVGR